MNQFTSEIVLIIVLRTYSTYHVHNSPSPSGKSRPNPMAQIPEGRNPCPRRRRPSSDSSTRGCNSAIYAINAADTLRSSVSRIPPHSSSWQKRS